MPYIWKVFIQENILNGRPTVQFHATEVCFMASGKIIKAKGYQFQVMLSSPATLLMAFEACSLAPCLDPLPQIKSKV